MYVCLSNITIGGDKCDPESRVKEDNRESVLVVVVSRVSRYARLGNFEGNAERENVANTTHKDE